MPYRVNININVNTSLQPPAKALELFMQDLMSASSKICTDRGGKRIEAYHLKQAIENTETLDFLKELVQAVADPTNGGLISEQELAESKAAEGSKKGRKRKPKVPEGEWRGSTWIIKGGGGL